MEIAPLTGADAVDVVAVLRRHPRSSPAHRARCAGTPGVVCDHRRDAASSEMCGLVTKSKGDAHREPRWSRPPSYFAGNRRLATRPWSSHTSHASPGPTIRRSEEHTSELQSRVDISY